MRTVQRETPSLGDALFRPRSVAVVGAGRSRGIGHQIMKNLLVGGFRGEVHPVNPNAREVLGRRAHASVRDVPDVDLAVIAVPAEAALGVVQDCVAAGVPAAVVITAGFRETGGQGAELERRVVAAAREGGMRIVGPNCMGLLNNAPDVRLNATFRPVDVPHGPIAFVSQSGALGIAALAVAERLGLGLHHFVSLGNRADVSSNDLLDVWAEDDDVRVVLLYLEHFGNPRNFIEAARRVSLRKPILAVKSGRSAAGAAAARSHTGSLAEADVWSEALLEQCGVHRARTIEELFDVAQAFARAPRPRGRRLAVLTNSGGPAIMAADAAEEYRLRVDELGEATQANLRRVLPAAASVRNPVDMTAGAEPGTYTRALEALLADDEVDAVLVVYTPVAYVDDEAVAAAIAEAPRGKPVLACVLGAERDDPAFRRLTHAGTATYAFPENAVRALAAYAAETERRAQHTGRVPELDVDADEAHSVLVAAAGAGREWLDAGETERVLAAYGIALPGQRTAHDADEAAEAAASLGYPVVVKAVSPGVVHKSDVGGVRLGLRSAAEVRSAYEAMVRRLGELGHRMEGAVVQQQVAEGRETVIGAVSDPSFGPMVMFGLGGIHVEVLHDVVFRLAPLTDAEAHRMVRAVRAWPVLEGIRGQPPADAGALEDLLLRVSRLASDQQAVRELDLNPVRVAAEGGGAVAVDARIRLWPGGDPPRAPGTVREIPEALG